MTRYPTSDSLDTSIERGAARAGCRAETSFRGQEIRCPDAKSVNLIGKDGRYEAECTGMNRRECEELLERIVGGSGGG